MTTTIDELLESKKKTVIKQPGSFRQKLKLEYNVL
jgi:hypothetical protein